MEYLPMRDTGDYGAAPRPSVAMLQALAEDVDAYIWANGDVDTARLVAVVTECCEEAGLGVGAA
jgi:hypothetical protein